MCCTHAISVTADRTIPAIHHDGPSDDWLVFCHGFLSDKSGSYEHRCERAVDEGYNAVRFDFGGCGDADGTFIDQTLSSRIADLRAVLDFFEASSYALFGSSFGAKVALHTAVVDDRVSAVAGRAPVTYNRTFDDVRSVVEHDGVFHYDSGQRLDHRFFDDFAAYPFADVTRRLDSPVALFHGTEDTSVALADSLEATGAFETDVLLQTFPGEGHRFSEAAETRLQHQLFDWLSLFA